MARGSDLTLDLPNGSSFALNVQGPTLEGTYAAATGAVAEPVKFTKVR